MSLSEPLLQVAATWPLPGLGLLALPPAAGPALAGYALHTALAVEATLPDGTRHAAHATVEEITRPEASAGGEGAGPVRGLLLTFAQPVELPPGTTIWLADAGQEPGLL